MNHKLISRVKTPAAQFQLNADPGALRRLRGDFRGRASEAEWLCPFRAHAYLRRVSLAYRAASPRVRAALRLALARPDVIIVCRVAA